MMVATHVFWLPVRSFSDRFRLNDSIVLSLKSFPDKEKKIVVAITSVGKGRKPDLATRVEQLVCYA